MSQPVPVRHPVPMRYRRRGGRSVLEGYLAATTPVRLTEADPSGFDPLGRLRRGVESRFREGDLVVDRPLYGRDGSLWADLHGPDRRPLRRAAFEAFLASGAVTGREDCSDLTLHLDRSPVMAAGAGYAERHRGIGPETVREFVGVDDGRARADLVRFLEDDVAVVEDRVRVRLRGACLRLRMLRDGEGDRERREWTAGVSIFPGIDYRVPQAGRLDLPAEFLAGAVRTRVLDPVEARIVRGPGEEGVESYLGLDAPFPFGLAASGPTHLFANACHAAVLRLSVVDEALRGARRDDAMPPGVAAAVAFSMRWARLGSMSAVRPSEYEGCIADFRTLVAALRTAFPRPANSHSMDRLERGLDAFVQADVPPGEAHAPAEDLGTLSGLAP